MRIGVNLLYLLPGVVGGTETYAAELLHAMASLATGHGLVVFVNQESRAWPLPTEGDFTRVVCPVRACSRARRYLYEQMVLPVMLRRYSVDVVHSLGYVAPLLAPCPSVVTVHDLNYRVIGDLMPAARRKALSFFVRQSAVRSERIITDSVFSRDQIVSLPGIERERVVVVSPAARFRAHVPNVHSSVGGGLTPRRRGPYIVAFSSRSTHKNMPRLVEAFDLARARYGLRAELVLVGHRAPEAPGPGMSGVIWTGYLDDGEVSDVLSGADMLVFPSLYEGFGLPVLEAQTAGIPVVCSRAASLPEVAGDAAYYFDPYSVEDMAVAIARVAADPELRDDLRQKGLQNVKRFSWERAARETLAVYEEVLGQSR